MAENRIMALFIVVLLLIAGGVIGAILEERAWHRITVERDFAEYNSVTGVWQWKESAISE